MARDNDLHDYIIYMYTFPNGKKYIGKSTRSMSRRQGHDWNRYSSCPLLWRAIQKYGTDSITTDILFNGRVTHDDAGELERHYIEEYKTNANKYRNPQYGYNLTDGGEGLVGWHPTPERYEQMMRQLEKAKEVRLSMPISDSTRKKMSDAKKGKPGTRRTPVKITSMNDGSVQIFESHLLLAEHFGVSNPTVTQWLKKGYIPKRNYLIENYTPVTTEANGGHCNDDDQATV